MSLSTMSRPIGCGPRRYGNPGVFEARMDQMSTNHEGTLMNTNMKAWLMVLLTALALFVSGRAAFAKPESKESPAQKEHKLIHVLRSKAAPADKALACKQLAIYGTKDAVPALARLLSNESLASWARIALEAIPGPAPDAALR